MDLEMQAFFDSLKKIRDELVVPLTIWNNHILDNKRIKPEQMPKFMISGEYVLTEEDVFEELVDNLKYLFYAKRRLTKDEGGFYLVVKLEPKKIMPKHDIFNVGLRQPGSFRS